MQTDHSPALDPLSAIYLSEDLGYVWLAMAIITFLCAVVAHKEGMKGRQELLIWYHVGFLRPLLCDGQC